MFEYLLLLTAALLHLIAPCAAVDFYVRPTQPTDQACHEPCHTLDQYAQNVSLFEGQTNISLLFLKGEHILTREMQLSGIDNLLITLSLVDNTTAVIDLQAGLTISNVTSSTIRKIQLKSVNGKVLNFHNVQNVTQYQVEIVNIDVKIISEELLMQSTVIAECEYTNSTLKFTSGSVKKTDIRIQQTNIQGNSHITGSRPGLSYSCSSFHIGLSLDIDNSTIMGWGHGIFISCGQLSDSEVSINNTFMVGIHIGVFVLTDIHTFTIKGTRFINASYAGVYLTGVNVNNFIIEDSEFFHNKIGLQADGTSDNLMIRDTNFTSNCQYGVLILQGSHDNVTIQDSQFIDNDYGVWIQRPIDNVLIQDTQFIDNDYGVYMHSSEVIIFIGQYIVFKGNNIGMIAFSTKLHNLLVRNSKFSNNKNIGMYIFTGEVTNISLSETNFSSNFGGIIQSDNKIDSENQIILFQKCTFASNNYSGIALIDFQGNTTIKDCSFHDNRGTPLLVYQSSVELGGETSFMNNEAVRGGALSLTYSTVVFNENANITFQNNSAGEFGGAIYVVALRAIQPEILIAGENAAGSQTIPGMNGPTCFYRRSGTTPQVHFINNSARLGGKDIYGASSYDESNCAITNSIFNFGESVPTTSLVTSDPTRVCVCDRNTTSQLCKEKILLLHETVFPGEKFTVPLVLVGYNFGTVTGTVFANLLGSENTGYIRQSEHLQTANFGQCNILNYTVFSNKTYEIIGLTAEQTAIQFESSQMRDDDIISSLNTPACMRQSPPCTAVLTKPIYVNITLEMCPLGFELNKDMACGCDDNIRQLKSTNVTCEAGNHTGYINREGTIWMGVDKSENDSDTYLMNKNCPHNYCNTSRIPVDLTNPDIQCNLNRSGVLCGSCAPDYSLQLGSNKCLKCPNNNTLALLIFFAAAGFLLVIFIKVLDLTVANATINGLIFYANVIWRYNDILFSLMDRQNIGYWILTVPIAWINLDFGIESCFYDSLDQIGKSLLQFVFPIYIWSIAGLIIFVSHYSTRATKLFGNNSVSVLATLFLLSYGKLLRNITDVFTFADLIGSNNNTRRVWSLDGNVRYGESYHIAAISVAVVFLILFVLPFTFTILFVPCLKNKSNLKPLHWINTLKPFFDTYYGPFKHKVHYQCWTGALLIVREILLIIFAFTSTSNPNANILSIGIIAIVLLMYSTMFSTVYKKWYQSMLENLYILNLAILGCTFLFYRTQTTSRPNELNPVLIVSISLALFEFACIIGFHLVNQCKKLLFREGKVGKVIEKKVVKQQPIKLEGTSEVEFDVLHVSYNDKDFRESLLESTR